MPEVWRMIPRKFGFKSFYQVSSYGRIRSVGHVTLSGRYFPGHVHKISYSKRGYPRVRMHVAHGNRAVSVDIHRLIALVFLSNPHHYKYVIHKNRNLFDNNVDNLKWSRLKTRNTNRGVVKSYNQGKVVPRPFYLDQAKKAFPSLMDAAKYVDKQEPHLNLKKSYEGIQRLVHGRAGKIYNQFTGHLIKKGK